MRKLKTVLTFLAVSCVVTTANAASMSFVYTGSNHTDNDGSVLASVGDLMAFDIVMDFTDDPTVGGWYDVYYTPDTLRFEAWELVPFGDRSFSGAPYFLDGLLQDAGFGSFDGLTGPATVARVSFTFLGGPIATMNLFAGHLPFIRPDFVTANENVDYGGATIRTPLPGAAWFLLSAVGALSALRRREAR